ncbi:beta-lactamase-like protein [Chytridium lagenaria]|nr:beta-lactamase-like protein [Chytridium lagenaria]
MKWFIQILGAATHDSRPSVIVHFDSQRYLFNFSWDCLGGLPGMLLTVADAGSKQMRIVGPAGTTHALAGMRHFLFRPSFIVDAIELPEDLPEYKDENLTVTSILLYPTHLRLPSHLLPSTPPTRRSPTPPHRRRQIERTVLSTMFGTPHSETQTEQSTCGKAPERRVKGLERLPKMERREMSLAFVCRGPDVPGRGLGVKVGTDFGRLSRGESVTLDNGTVVHPHQCVAPTRPGSVFCVIDCPNPSYVASIIASPGLEPETLCKRPVRSVVHMLGKGHIVASVDHTPCETLLHSTVSISGYLNRIDPDIFPMPYSSDVPDIDLSSVPNLPKTTIASRPQLIHQLEPKTIVDAREVPKRAPPPDPATDDLLRRCLEEVEAGKTNAVEANGSSHAAEGVDGKGEMVVVPLGTGAAIPSKYRNVSSTLLLLPEGNVILDSGEGTLGQMFRHFGPGRFEEEVLRVRLMFVSHLHADHHLGTVGLLKRRRELDLAMISKGCVPPPLYVLAPRTFLDWLDEYADCEDFGLDSFVLVASEEVLWTPLDEREAGGDGKVRRMEEGRERMNGMDVDKKIGKSVKDMMVATGMTSIQAVGVIHCPSAYGVVLKHKNGSSFVFSGDCRPTENLVKAGRGASLLIHEATFEDDKQHEAIEKKHCTASEAVQVARDMQAERVLLTHFSQRYPKLPNIQVDSTSPTSDSSVASRKRKLGQELMVGVAFDSMRIGMGEFGKMERLMGPLRTLWRDVQEGE